MATAGPPTAAAAPIAVGIPKPIDWKSAGQSRVSGSEHGKMGAYEVLMEARVGGDRGRGGNDLAHAPEELPGGLAPKEWLGKRGQALDLRGCSLQDAISATLQVEAPRSRSSASAASVHQALCVADDL